MAIKTSLADEIGENLLLQGGGVTGRKKLRTREIIHERRRGNDVTKSQCREERLREGPDINDAIVAIQTLDGRDRPRHKAELAIIVVFKNVCICVACPLKHSQPSGQGHQSPTGELM